MKKSIMIIILVSSSVNADDYIYKPGGYKPIPVYMEDKKNRVHIREDTFSEKTIEARLEMLPDYNFTTRKTKNHIYFICDKNGMNKVNHYITLVVLNKDTSSDNIELDGVFPNRTGIFDLKPKIYYKYKSPEGTNYFYSINSLDKYINYLKSGYRFNIRLDGSVTKYNDNQGFNKAYKIYQETCQQLNPR